MKDGRIRGYMGFGAVCCLESWLMLISLILRKYFTIPTRFQRITETKGGAFWIFGRSMPSSKTVWASRVEA